MSQEMKIIAKIHTDFPTKFGVPRQSGLVNELKVRIVFLPEYRQEEAFRGLEDFSHIWILWEFSQAKRKNWAATVTPPRLGGRVHMGVFATRSPFRPNPIGLSCVRLDEIVFDEKLGPVLHVSGVDMVDGTPVYDIKPYLPYADAHPEASSGFAGKTAIHELKVDFPEEELQKFPPDRQSAAVEILRQDPRPIYRKSEDQVFKLEFAGWDIHFTVDGEVLTVLEVVRRNHS
ncbi:MAG: tRNA (N6-threonylcarbamoyladenosine(37)-N6)-methyltransferase TrmO [Lachnospiraceae bacterium]|nr:tRNA (N6-threonylcarbamoyladenosine(37)-N6)-methyltransferase TrmO [Lachnospiraceae bacterium]